MASRYWVGGTAAWDGTAGTKWALTSGGAGGQAVPTAADDVFFDASSGAGTVTVSTTTALCNNISFAGFTGTFAGSVAMTVSGSFAWGAGMTRTYTGSITFNATSTGKTITSNGKTFGGFLTCDGVGGGWTLADALNSSATLTITNGSFSTGNFSLTLPRMASNNSNVRSVLLGSSTVTLTSNDVTFSPAPWGFTTNTNLTWNAGTSTLLFTDSTANDKSFNGGGLVYNIVEFAGTGTGKFNLNGPNKTINTLRLTNAPKTLNIAYTEPTTITNAVLSGTAGNLNIIKSSNTGVASLATCAVLNTTNNQDLDYCNVINIQGNYGARWFFGRHSTNGGNNIGVAFCTRQDAAAMML